MRSIAMLCATVFCIDERKQLKAHLMNMTKHTFLHVPNASANRLYT